MPEFSEFRYGELEYREDGPADDDYLGKSIGGTILRYGDEATFPWGKERFEPGAFGDVSKLDLIANRMHQRMQPIARNGEKGNLVVKDTPTELSGTVRLLNNSAGRDTDLEVRMGLLRGQSIEFQAKTDRIVDGTRIISGANLYGHGIVDRAAYPDSKVGTRMELRSWDDYFAAMEYRTGLYVPPKPEPEPVPALADIPEWARQSTYLDHKGRLIFVGGDLDCRYEDFDVEERQMPKLRGRMPYGVDGITSMARNEHVRFLPGAFADSLDGEILALVGNNYDDPLGGTAQRSLSFTDTDEALEFRTGRIPETSTNRDFIAKHRAGFVRGVTAGWALQGSDTTTEAIPGGGTRIVVRKAMLCELRFRTRSAFAGESIQASRRNERRALVV